MRPRAWEPALLARQSLAVSHWGLFSWNPLRSWPLATGLGENSVKNAGRILAFLVALIAITGAVGGVVWFFANGASGGGTLSIGLCALSSPDDLVLGAYLEAHADELQRPAGSDDTPVAFEVQPGETAAAIASRLEREELISSAELFRRYAQYHGLDAGIEAGEFTLRQTMTIPEIARALQEGRRPEQVVTVQEGLRLEQIASVVAEQTTIEEDQFLRLATTGWRDRGYSFAFLSDLPADATLEGFLFPDTYRLPEQPTAGDVLDRMLSTFDARVASEMGAAAAERGLTVYELVTLASIVEREAVLGEERPLIASVYHNRLEAGWSLDADPTVQYEIGDVEEWWPVLTLDDLEVDSPYNTYRHPGLPPSPICSPGLASIRAAAHPADTDYFFFLVDCTKDDGSHLFAVTQAEHNANYSRCGGQLP